MTNVVTSLLLAIAVVESGNDSAAVGDGGRAIGIYQIHRSYWLDSGVLGRWENCHDADYSRRVVLGYWQRYCPESLRQGDAQVLARVHHGGPVGHRRRHTVPYWYKVNSVTRRLTLGMRAPRGPQERSAAAGLARTVRKDVM